MADTSLRRQFNEAAHARPPEGWRGDLFFYNSRDQQIRYGYAPSIGPEPRGTIVLTHGYDEHINLYHEVIRHYQELGFEVFAMDWQGYGLSQRNDPQDPGRPSDEGMDHHVDDLHFFVEHIVKERTMAGPDAPLVLSTNSMGGHIGHLYLQRHPGIFDGAVMSTPMLDIYRGGLPDFVRPALQFVFNAASWLGFKDYSVPNVPRLLEKIEKVSAYLTGDDTYERGNYNMDFRASHPALHVKMPTFGWLSSIFKTIAPSLEEDALRRMKTPVLIGSAGRDYLVDNGAHEKVARLMPNARLAYFENAGHSLWFQNDENYNNWWNQVESFLDDIAPDPAFAPALYETPAPAPVLHRFPTPAPGLLQAA